MTQKNLKIKIVGFWFFLLGIFTILAIVAIGFSIYAYISALNALNAFSDLGTEPFNFPVILLLLTLLLNIPLLGFLAYILFKIRLSLYKLDKEGYAAALIFLIISEVSLILNIPLQLLYIKKSELWSVVASIIFIFLNLLFINFLLSGKKYFAEDTTQQKGLSRKLIIILILSLLNIPLVFASQKSFEFQEKSRREETSKKLDDYFNKFEAKERAVTSWQTYKNNEFHFSMKAPSNIYSKIYDYSTASRYRRNVKYIVFSGKELPNSAPDPDEYITDDAILIIEVYPISDKLINSVFNKLQSETDKQKIFNFKDRLGYISDYGGIYLEYAGNIYVFEPERQNPVKSLFKYTDISNRMLESFQFAE